jgi:hypothetical protein
MKTFSQFIEEDGPAAPAATSTVGVAGAGDNPQKIVPVRRKKLGSSLLKRKLI